MKINGYNPSDLPASKTAANNTPKAEPNAAQVATSAASNAGVSVVITSTSRTQSKDPVNQAAEIARVADQVGKEGQIGQRMSLPGAGGGWADVIDSMNTLVADMAYPVIEVARVIGSVAKGDLSQTMVLEVEGRPLRGEAAASSCHARSVSATVHACAKQPRGVCGASPSATSGSVPSAIARCKS